MLVLEDGTGEDPTANSYASVAEFTAYFTDRGFDYTTFTPGAIERSLISATDYIDLNNKRWFKGHPVDVDQPLAFPRECCYIDLGGGAYRVAEGVPPELKRATFEYAKRVLTSEDGDLMPDPADKDETGQTLLYSFEKIGPIETKIDYVPGTGAEVRSYPYADKLLLPLLRGGGGGNGSIRN
jgi:hypothetical protein